MLGGTSSNPKRPKAAIRGALGAANNILVYTTYLRGYVLGT